MKIAVVTGAARGIGFEIARRLTKDGYRLVLVDVDPRVGDSAASIDATPVKADIADPEGRAQIRSAIRSEEGQPTLLVNNAGITRDALIGDMTEPNFRLVNRINLGATFELTSELADEIVDGGAVVNISSRAYLGNVGQFNYAISKGGVVGLTHVAEPCRHRREEDQEPECLRAQLAGKRHRRLDLRVEDAIEPLGRLADEQAVAEQPRRMHDAVDAPVLLVQRTY